MFKVTSAKITAGLIIALLIGGFLYQAVGPAYASDEEAAAALYQKARNYELFYKDFQMAKNVFQQLIGQYPDSPEAAKANIGGAKLDVWIAIGSNDLVAAQAGTDKMVSDFPTHPDLTIVLCEIAHTYLKAGEYQRAKSVFQMVTEQFGDDQYASWAQLGIGLADIMSHFASGDFAAVQTVTDELIASFGGHPYLANVLRLIAREYSKLKKYEQVISLYQQIIQLYPNSVDSEVAQMDIEKIRIRGYFVAEDEAAIQTAVDELFAASGSNAHTSMAIMWVAEQYDARGRQLQTEGFDEQGRAELQKAMAIFERLVNELPNSSEAPHVCSYIGRYYQEQGQYTKSTEYYENIIDSYASSNFVSHALLMVGRNYENLAEAGGISQLEANSAITVAYEQLVAEYPDSKPAVIAHRWLSKNSSN